MPLDVRPGSVLPIPCRACGKAILRWTFKPGEHKVRCSQCEGETLVEAKAETLTWRIWTSAVPSPHPARL